MDKNLFPIEINISLVIYFYFLFIIAAIAIWWSSNRMQVFPHRIQNAPNWFHLSKLETKSTTSLLDIALCLATITHLVCKLLNIMVMELL